MPGFAQVRISCLLHLFASLHQFVIWFWSSQMFFFYFLSSRVIRSVPYGKKPRQRLDIFVPKNHWKSNDGLRPVVIYVTGSQSHLV